MAVSCEGPVKFGAGVIDGSTALVEFSAKPVDALPVCEKVSSTVFVPAERLCTPPTTFVRLAFVVKDEVFVFDFDFDETLDTTLLKPRTKMLPSPFPDFAGSSIANEGAMFTVARLRLADGTVIRVRYR